MVESSVIPPGSVHIPADVAHEFVRDLFLLGYGLVGEYTAHKSGHDLNNKLVRAVLADCDCHDIVTFGEAETATWISRGR